MERQERLQNLRQTWKSSIWSEEDNELYTLRDPEVPLVYSLHYGQQCPPECDDSSLLLELLIGREKMSFVRATSMLRWFFNRKSRV